VLLRLASDALILTEKSAESWVVPLQTLKGAKIKKQLATSKLGFLLQTDVDALNIRFSDGIKTFNDFNTQYPNFTFKEYCELDAKIKRANQAVHELDRVADHIIDQRASVLYPATVGRKKKSKQEPLKERLAKIDVVDFINRFTPSEACDLPRFTVSYSSITPTGQEDWELETLEHQYFGYVRTHPGWKDVLTSWWNTEFLPRFG
jgi:hypothetical protein